MNYYNERKFLPDYSATVRVICGLLIAFLIFKHTSPHEQAVNWYNENIQKSVTSWPTDLLQSALSAGFLTMIIVEMRKTVIRCRFNKKHIENWIADTFNFLKEKNIPVNLPLRDKQYNNIENDTLQDLILLSTGGDEKSFYNLPADSLCGQINVGIQTVLEFPGEYSLLMYLMVGKNLEKKQIASDFDKLVPAHQPVQDSNQVPVPDQTIESDQTVESDQVIELKNRIGNYMQRNLDALQISLVRDWKKKLKDNAFSSSLLLSVLGSLLLGSSAGWITQSAVIIFQAFAGAFLASVFRDIYSILEKNKR